MDARIWREEASDRGVVHRHRFRNTKCDLSRRGAPLLASVRSSNHIFISNPGSPLAYAFESGMKKRRRHLPPSYISPVLRGQLHLSQWELIYFFLREFDFLSRSRALCIDTLFKRLNDLLFIAVTLISIMLSPDLWLVCFLSA